MRTVGRLQRDPRPLYQQVQDLIVADIESGVFGIGEKLPTEDELAAELGVSRPTVRTALANVEAIGFVHRVHGGGTFVSKRRAVVRNPLDSIESLHPHLARRMGYTSYLTNLTIDQIVADEALASRMRRETGTPVTRVTRVVEIDETPIAYLVDLVPDDVVSVDVMRSGFRDSVLDYLTSVDIEIDWFEMTVSAQRAHLPVSDLLRVSTGSILLVFDGDLTAEDGRYVAASTGHFVPESVEITARRRVKRHKQASQSPLRET
ncbi:MAG: GntR family transcriptional regulator [Acidimicrobiia bacterium]|nr:GntR family transcriptional regulator [Acidimicrobiia bacterium]